jgi:hypothetical protein
MSKSYIASVNQREPRPRSSRLRELGTSGTSVKFMGSGSELTPEQLTGLKRLMSWFDYDDVRDAVFVKPHISGNDEKLTNFYVWGNSSAGGIGESRSSGSTVRWTQIYDSQPRVQIATIAIDGVDTPVYAPQGGTSALAALTIGQKSYNGSNAVTVQSSDIVNIIGYTPYNAANIGSASVGSADKLNRQVVSDLNDAAPYRFFESSNNTPAHNPTTTWAQGITVAMNNNSDYRQQLLISSRLYLRSQNGGSWSGWNTLAFTSDIPTNNNQLTNGAGYITSSGSCAYATSAGYSGKVLGSYTGNGGQQNPNYFGMSRVGFLMMNTTVNGNSQYKDWLIMDCYTGNDVGGGVAIGVNRQSLGAYIMRSEAARGSWSQSAELYGTHNCNNASTPWSCSNLTASGTVAPSADKTYTLGTTSAYWDDFYVKGVIHAYHYNKAAIQPFIVFDKPGSYVAGIGPDGTANRIKFGPVDSITSSNPAWVGVATFSSNEWYFQGNIVATGQVSSGSDRRWKDNITSISDNVIDSLRPCEWEWKEGHGKGHSAGLIAQEVAGVLPFAVMGSEKDGYTLNYNVFHAYEIAELQSLRRRVKELERQLNIN